MGKRPKMPDLPPTRVFLRPIGSPLAMGMAGLAIGSLVQSGFDLGWVAKSDAVEVGLTFVAVPFLLQLVASLFAYLARDGAVATCAGILATTWLTLGLLHITSPGRTNGALGLLLVAAAGVLALSAAGVATGKLLTATVFILAALRFAVAGVYELSSVAAWQDAAGVIGLVVCALAAYSVLALDLEGQRRAPVLPTFRRGRGELSLTGDWAAQQDGVVHEPGVRQTS